MTTLIELLKASTLTQFMISFIILVIWGVMMITGKTVPNTLDMLVIVVVSFYFGSKVGVLQGVYQERQRKDC